MILLVYLASLARITAANDNFDRRPFYNIAHMVNSIPEIDMYLRRGANAIEADIEFTQDGLAKFTFHGLPCDCFRRCMHRTNFVDYLEYVRKITMHGDRAIALLMLDLKVDSLVNTQSQLNAGKDLFQKLVDHLWYTVEKNRTIDVLISIPTSNQRAVFKGILTELNKEDNLKYREKIGFDVGMNSPLNLIRDMYQELQIESNIWQGDGITNCLSTLRPEGRLLQAIGMRDSTKGYSDKVYHWTIDLTSALELSLRAGVDAIITNHPERLNGLLRSGYSSQYRLATRQDSPWTKVMKISKSGPTRGNYNPMFDLIINILEVGQQATTYFYQLVGIYNKKK